jgi:hypothetical protein
MTSGTVVVIHQEQPGAEHRAIQHLAPHSARERKLGDVAGELANAAVVQLELDRHRLAEHCPEVDVGVFRGQVELVAERATELFVAAHRRQHERVAERALHHRNPGLTHDATLSLPHTFTPPGAGRGEQLPRLLIELAHSPALRRSLGWVTTPQGSV